MLKYAALFAFGILLARLGQPSAEFAPTAVRAQGPSSSISRQAGSSSGFASLLEQIERAVNQGLSQKLLEYGRELEGYSQDSAVSKFLCPYSRAYVDWRLSLVLKGRGKDEKRLLKEAQSTLEALVEKDPDNAEALALLGSVYGARIGGFWQGITLGPKSGKALDRAEELAPDNPRVALQQGISAIFTPGLFGGGLDKAEKKLREAEKLFELESPEKPWPNWGRVDVQAWLGQVLAKKGDRSGARAALEKGLSLQPDHWWIRNVLLPALDK